MQSLRQAARSLARSGGFSAFVVVTLALGIGASALIFSVIHGVLLEPLPYPGTDRIVRVFQLNERGGLTVPSDPNFLDIQRQSRSFSALAQFESTIESVSGGSEPARIRVAIVSREFNDVLGTQPMLGRAFAPEEQQIGGAPAALISYGYWQRYLGGTPDFESRTLRIGDRLHTIVGVMPRGFDYPDGADVWTPRELWPVFDRTAHNLDAIGASRRASGSSRRGASCTGSCSLSAPCCSGGAFCSSRTPIPAFARKASSS